MTINELNDRLTELLRQAIKEAGHYKSGHLYNSVNFRCTFSENYLDVQLDTPEYIYYLEDGDFMDRFWSNSVVATLLLEFIESNIEPKIEEMVTKPFS